MGLRKEFDRPGAFSYAFNMRPGASAEYLGQAPAALSPPSHCSRRPAATASQMRVVVVSTAVELEVYISPWEDLASNAVEANIFYEPWLLMPALKAFGEDRKLQFVFLFDSSSEQSAPLLCGFFPLERSRTYRGLPASVLTLWKHPHCYLCTPLMRAGYERECLESFFEWLDSESDCGLMEFGSIGAEGPFKQTLEQLLEDRPRAVFSSDCHERALFRPASSADAYLRAAISRSHKKDIDRRRRRLSELGHIECVAASADDDVEVWIEDFLRLEAGGWKGREGTALASKDSDRAFFSSAVREAFKRGRLMMLALRLNGEPIAVKCSFSGGEGAFAFKIAFDESHAHFSPGLLLEIENIKQLHQTPAVRWMDSCAVPNHFMINRLWPDRRRICSVLIAAQKRSGSFIIVSLLPVIRAISRALRLGGKKIAK